MPPNTITDLPPNFGTMSPHLFTSITCAQGEPALVCGKHRAPAGDLPNQVFYGWCQSSFTVLGNKHKRNSGPQATHVRSASDCLVRDIHTSGLLAVLILFLLTQRRRYWFCWWFKVPTALSSSPRVSFMLLRQGWETHQNCWQLLMCQSGGVLLPVQTLQVGHGNRLILSEVLLTSKTNGKSQKNNKHKTFLFVLCCLFHWHQSSWKWLATPSVTKLTASINRVHAALWSKSFPFVFTV